MSPLPSVVDSHYTPSTRRREHYVSPRVVSCNSLECTALLLPSEGGAQELCRDCRRRAMRVELRGHLGAHQGEVEESKK